jgi:hypothetical protein
LEKEMKKLYVEGLAIHGDPESCAGRRKEAGEALTGAHAGRAIEPRKQQVSGADGVVRPGRQHDPERKRERWVDPTRSKNLSMRRVSRRENREIPKPPEPDGAAGRGEKAKAVRRR